jgi:hypothetical protein
MTPDDDAMPMVRTSGTVSSEMRKTLTHVQVLSFALYVEVTNRKPSKPTAVNNCISWFNLHGKDLTDYGELNGTR